MSDNKARIVARDQKTASITDRLRRDYIA